MSFRKTAAALVLCATVVGCAGAMTRGPNGEPSPWEVGIKATGEAYNESPWTDFGPYGALIAAVIAGTLGTQKGLAVYKARKNNGQPANSK